MAMAAKTEFFGTYNYATGDMYCGTLDVTGRPNGRGALYYFYSGECDVAVFDNQLNQTGEGIRYSRDREGSYRLQDGLMEGGAVDLEEALRIMELEDTPGKRHRDEIKNAGGFDPARHKCTRAFYNYRALAGLPDNESPAGMNPWMPVWRQDECERHVPFGGGVAALVDYTNEVTGNGRMPSIMALGYIAAYSERLAMAVIVLHSITPLADALKNEQQDYVRAAAAWALGQIGRHTPEHAKHVADANVFPTLVAISGDESLSQDLRNKASKALKNILQKCVHLPALEALLSEAPPDTLQHVVAQFAKVLPNDAKARKLFVTSGGLKKVQEIKATEGSSLAESISVINGSFPTEIVKYYSPGYSETLLNRMDGYEPSSVPA